MTSPTGPGAPGSPAAPRPAAAVVLVREAASGGLEVLLVRRHRGASFMSSASVFPGGVADPGEDDLRLTAVRELFEEAGVLLGDRALSAGDRAALRAEVDAGASFLAGLSARGAAPALAALHPLSRWITPSLEPRRYDARFFVARLPTGQDATVDARETTELVWLSPREALGRAAELRLPPPQRRTFVDLEAACAAGWDALAAEAARRAALAPAPIVPRLVADPLPTILFPWDPAYADAPGDGIPWPAGHPLATPPSRVTLDPTNL